MIRPLRRRHRWVFTLLAVLLPALFAAALLARQAPPPPTPQVYDQPPGPLVEMGSWGDLWSSADESEILLDTALLRERKEPRSSWLSLVPRGGWTAAEPLVYWRPGSGAPSTLDESFRLLGRLSAARGEEAFLPLPAEAESGGGQLVLYSLGFGQVIATAALPDLAREGG